MSGSKPSKRSKTREFGAPTVDDEIPPVSYHNTSSSASSTRAPPITTIPTLTSLCAKLFATNFLKLSNNQRTWDRASNYLESLPEHLVPKVFNLVKESYPTFLEHKYIVTYFFKGSSIALDTSLPGVEKKTLLAIPRVNPGLLHLELSGFSKIPDSAFASVVLKLSSLRTLVLRGSIKVGVDTMRAASKCCDLKKLNINYTSVSPVSLLPLLLACPNLEVLKLAGIQNWTDATFNHLNAGMGDTVQLPHLHTLKLRQTSLSDNSLSSFVSRCPSLERLDMSFTPVRRLANIILPTSLSYINKLSLTSTAVAIKDLISLLPHLIQLQNLSLGALGKGTSMTDGGLREMIPALEPLQLSSISLVGNIRLGISSSAANSAILYFFRSVGRKCKSLNLASLTHLRASDLQGLIPLAADDVSLLENLILNNTGVDDSAAPFLTSCPHLVTLGVAGTKITRDGLFPILDSCRQLQNLDLTSCRGVSVTDRRRFFEVWAKERGL